MENPLQINLPVMLHFDEEVQAFLEAKQRLETLGQKHNVLIDVGAFLLYLPKHARTPENFRKQIENQKKYALPIRLAETGVEGSNGLSYGKGDPTYNPDDSSDIELVIDQVARLRDLDINPLESLVVAPQVGIMVADIEEDDFSKSCFYPLKYFVENREVILYRVKERFSQLQEYARKNGLTLAIENALLAQIEDSSYWHSLKHKDSEITADYKLNYGVFNDLESLTEISQRNIVFDLAHFAAEVNTPGQFEANKDSVNPESLFDTMGISSWLEYHGAIGQLDDYLVQARAVHLSQVEGIGLRLSAGTEAARRWGGGGELPPLISVETQQYVLREAQSRGLPVSLEPEYSLKPLTYEEADALVEPILEIYSK